MARPMRRPRWPSSPPSIRPSFPPSTASRGFGAPVTGISKFVAIGLNYIDHAKETGNPIPSEPIFFLKANTA